MQNCPDELPHPELVARAAAEAAAPRVLEDYNEAISILRDKKFTFREIAEWLTETFGIPADHNSVWRAHTKHMNAYQAHQEVEADEETERDEAMAEAYANGTYKNLPQEPPKTTEVASQAEAAVPPVNAKPKKAKLKNKK
jgi:hypothetical protein